MYMGDLKRALAKRQCLLANTALHLLARVMVHDITSTSLATYFVQSRR